MGNEKTTPTYTPPEFKRDVTKVPKSHDGTIKLTKEKNRNQLKELTGYVAEQQDNPNLPAEQKEELKSWWQIVLKHTLTVDATNTQLKFKNPESLVLSFVEYLQWNEANPILEEKQRVLSDGQVIRHSNPLARVPTLTGWLVFIGLDNATWYNYYKVHSDFKEAVQIIENVIRTRKMEGATAGIFNPLVIMRDLGLKDRHATELTGKDGKPIESEINTNGKDHLDITDWSADKKMAFRNMLDEALKLSQGEESDGIIGPGE